MNGQLSPFGNREDGGGIKVQGHGIVMSEQSELEYLQNRAESELEFLSAAP